MPWPIYYERQRVLARLARSILGVAGRVIEARYEFTSDGIAKQTAIQVLYEHDGRRLWHEPQDLFPLEEGEFVAPPPPPASDSDESSDAAFCAAPSRGAAAFSSARERRGEAEGERETKRARRKHASMVLGEEEKEKVGEEEEAEEEVEEKDEEVVKGYRLLRSSKSSTGYTGVMAHGSRFHAKLWSGGKQIHIGSYPTAVDAAVAVAKWSGRDVMEEREEEADLVGGYRLLRSSRSSTGYTGVRQIGGRFKAELRSGGKMMQLGTYDTAVKAAVAISKYSHSLAGGGVVSVVSGAAVESAAMESEAVEAEEGEAEAAGEMSKRVSGVRPHPTSRSSSSTGYLENHMAPAGRAEWEEEEEPESEDWVQCDSW